MVLGAWEGRAVTLQYFLHFSPWQTSVRVFFFQIIAFLYSLTFLENSPVCIRQPMRIVVVTGSQSLPDNIRLGPQALVYLLISVRFLLRSMRLALRRSVPDDVPATLISKTGSNNSD